MSNAEQRFWANVIPEPNSGCWLWFGGIDLYGYGRFRGNDGYLRVRAHRFSWELHCGPIPEGQIVCHRCDMPCCVNPDHLFLGDTQVNIDDKIQKKRHKVGSQVRSAKLTESDILEIRASPRSTYDLGERYGVDASLIGRIKNLKAWKHVRAKI